MHDQTDSQNEMSEKRQRDHPVLVKVAAWEPLKASNSEKKISHLLPFLFSPHLPPSLQKRPDIRRGLKKGLLYYRAIVAYLTKQIERTTLVLLLMSIPDVDLYFPQRSLLSPFSSPSPKSRINDGAIVDGGGETTFSRYA